MALTNWSNETPQPSVAYAQPTQSGQSGQPGTVDGGFGQFSGHDISYWTHDRLRRGPAPRPVPLLLARQCPLSCGISLSLNPFRCPVRCAPR
jgi:hypothetical protein